MEKYIDGCLKIVFLWITSHLSGEVLLNVKKKKRERKKRPKVSTWCFLEQREKHPASDLGFIYIAHFIQQA